MTKKTKSKGKFMMLLLMLIVLLTGLLVIP